MFWIFCILGVFRGVQVPSLLLLLTLHTPEAFHIRSFVAVFVKSVQRVTKSASNDHLLLILSMWRVTAPPCGQRGCYTRTVPNLNHHFFENSLSCAFMQFPLKHCFCSLYFDEFQLLFHVMFTALNLPDHLFTDEHPAADQVKCVSQSCIFHVRISWTCGVIQDRTCSLSPASSSSRCSSETNMHGFIKYTKVIVIKQLSVIFLFKWVLQHLSATHVMVS